MRIIGGALKRRKIIFPKSRSTRPVTDRSKETIFNVLGGLTQSAYVLDLFAGSGSLGLEALSRGSEEATFVDLSSEAESVITKNLQSLQLTDKGEVLKMEVSQALHKLQNGSKKYHLVFLDPPHNKGLTKKTLIELDRSDTIRPLGTIVVGHSNKEGLPEDVDTLKFQRSIKIGQAFVSFLVKTGAA
jgi:16S rRNA (guanine966-N2)-methyltransferase